MRYETAYRQVRYAYNGLIVRLNKTTTARIVPENRQTEEPPLLVINRRGRSTARGHKSRLSALRALARMTGPGRGIHHGPTCPECGEYRMCVHAIDPYLFFAGTGRKAKNRGK